MWHYSSLVFCFICFPNKYIKLQRKLGEDMAITNSHGIINCNLLFSSCSTLFAFPGNVAMTVLSHPESLKTKAVHRVLKDNGFLRSSTCLRASLHQASPRSLLLPQAAAYRGWKEYSVLLQSEDTQWLRLERLTNHWEMTASGRAEQSCAVEEQWDAVPRTY